MEDMTIGLSTCTLRCVVLVGEREPRPEALISGLHRRGVQTTVVPDAPAVMVELANGPVRAVIVHETKRVGQLNELLAAAQRYYPKLGYWQYRSGHDPSGGGDSGGGDSGGGARLTKLEPSERFETHRKPESQMSSVPRMHRASDTVESMETRALDPTTSESASHVVTQEEIAMLIGPPLGKDHV